VVVDDEKRSRERVPVAHEEVESSDRSDYKTAGSGRSRVSCLGSGGTGQVSEACSVRVGIRGWQHSLELKSVNQQPGYTVGHKYVNESLAAWE